MKTALVIKSEMQSCTVSNVLSSNSCIVWVKANIFIWSIPKVWQLIASTPFPINTWWREFYYTLSRSISLKLKGKLSKSANNKSTNSRVDCCPVTVHGQRHDLNTTVLAYITEYGVHFRLHPIFTSKPETAR